MSNGNVDYVAKINKILRKAENAGTVEESKLFFDKAEELMVRYAIEEAQLDEARGEMIDKIISDHYDFTGTYRKTLFNFWHIASVNDVKVTISGNVVSGYRENGSAINGTRLHLYGFESNVNATKLLLTSMELQVLKSMKTWWREVRHDYDDSLYTSLDQKRARQSFINGFAGEVHGRLSEAKRNTIVKVDEEQGNTVSVNSVALVLRSRKEQVNDWYDKKYGTHKRGTYQGGSGMSGGSGAYGAGRDAGSRADIGSTRVGGTRGQLEQ